MSAEDGVTGIKLAQEHRNNLRAMLGRGTLSSQEVRTLNGVISSIERKHERPKANRTNKGQSEEPARQSILPAIKQPSKFLQWC